jgi:hypothetical protein
MTMSTGEALARIMHQPRLVVVAFPNSSEAMLRFSVLLLACFVATAVHAAALAPAARAEIDGLLSRLEVSSCEFSRNGSWYSAADAKSHLLRKLKYLEDKGLVHTAEQFVERGATSSSTTGAPYLVRCGTAAPVQSGTWLLQQLQEMRAAGSGKRTP